MDDFFRTVIWVAAGGAVGGAVAAWVTDNVHLFPARVVTNDQSMTVRPGLALSAVVGVSSAVAVFVAFASVACRADSSSTIALAIAAALAIGGLAASWVAGIAEKHLLRAAAVHAARAPAAHPDTITAMESATAYHLFDTARHLSPEHRRLR